MTVNRRFCIQSTALVLAFAWTAVQAEQTWQQFRGSGGRSSAPTAKVPTDLNLDSNWVWKAEVPGRGVSSPVLMGDLVVVTSSGGSQGEHLFVTAWDQATGERRWERRFWATGRPYCHPTSANAAPTPCTDEDRVYALFSSNDLVCLDRDGRLQWYRGLTYDSPHAANDVGMSSSPVLAGDVVVVQIENQGDSFVAGIRRDNGQTAWKAARPREASWSSPLVVTDPADGNAIVLVQGSKALVAYDAQRGEEVWSQTGSCNIIPSSASDGERLFVPLNGMSALRIGGDGPPKLDWDASKAGPGSASAVVHEGTVYTVNRAGVLSAIDAESGTAQWQKRIGGQYWATPVAIGHYLYLFDEGGTGRCVDLAEK
ncbi:MAG TPA: PQQ-binding-like beta-propeller repeat protein, partial [Pirellulaceae bacterium]